MPVKIFFCYAHEDEVLLNQLKRHLRPLQRQGLIDYPLQQESVLFLIINIGHQLPCDVHAYQKGGSRW